MKNPQDDAKIPVDGPVLDRSLELVRFLRQHCEWDAAQTPDSLVPYLLEESHEVAEAIGDRDETGLRDELGDLLLNIAFQIVLAEERRAFDAEAVTAAMESKMRRRHPHLYGDGPPEAWEAMKARERSAASNSPDAASVLDRLPKGLDPLSRAHRIQDRVASLGFDWDDVAGPLAKVKEEVAEVEAAVTAGDDPEAVEEEIGDLFFACVNLARRAGVHSLRALQRANAKFAGRFQALERLARERGVDLDAASLEEMDVLWDEVKRGI